MLEQFRRGFGNERAKDERKHLNMYEEHFSRLYDQDEDMSGEKVDLATGERIDNSSQDPGAPELSVFKRKITEEGGQDALPPLPPEDDEAARWLREHGEA